MFELFPNLKKSGQNQPHWEAFDKVFPFLYDLSVVYMLPFERKPHSLVPSPLPSVGFSVPDTQCLS